MRPPLVLCLLIAAFGATPVASAGESARDIVNRHLDVLKKCMQENDVPQILHVLIYLEPLAHPKDENADRVALRHYANVLLNSDVKDASFQSNVNITVVMQNKDIPKPDHTFEIFMYKPLETSDFWAFVIPRAVRENTNGRHVIRRRSIPNFPWCLWHYLGCDFGKN